MHHGRCWLLARSHSADRSRLPFQQPLEEREPLLACLHRILLTEMPDISLPVLQPLTAPSRGVCSLYTGIVPGRCPGDSPVALCPAVAPELPSTALKPSWLPGPLGEADFQPRGCSWCFQGLESPREQAEPLSGYGSSPMGHDKENGIRRPHLTAPKNVFKQAVPKQGAGDQIRLSGCQLGTRPGSPLAPTPTSFGFWNSCFLYRS